MNSIKRVLAIETSCDDTSVAIVESDGTVVSVISASQNEAHRPFGGVVPEIASRNHTHFLLPLVQANFEKSKMNWKDIEGIVVTSRPGLVGALLVGVVTAKTLAMVKELPLKGVNHLEGHLMAPFLKDASYAPPKGFSFPYVALAVSGGHTSLYLVKNFGEYQVLGSTIDDAAGEAFDKFAKMVGLPYPGGVEVDQKSRGGNSSAYHFPRALMVEGNLDFSFSGVKASAQRTLLKMSQQEITANLSDLCASYQEAVCEALIKKLDVAVKKYLGSERRAILTGGVSANSRLRFMAEEWAKNNKVQLVIPPARYCTDNAAMIGYAGILRLNRGERDGLDLTASPEVSVQ